MVVGGSLWHRASNVGFWATAQWWTQLLHLDYFISKRPIFSSAWWVLKYCPFIFTPEKLGEMMIQFDDCAYFLNWGVGGKPPTSHTFSRVCNSPMPGSPVFLHARYEEGRQSGTVSWWIFLDPKLRRCPKHHTLGTFYDHNWICGKWMN